MGAHTRTHTLAQYSYASSGGGRGGSVTPPFLHPTYSRSNCFPHCALSCVFTMIAVDRSGILSLSDLCQLILPSPPNNKTHTALLPSRRRLEPPTSESTSTELNSQPPVAADAGEVNHRRVLNEDDAKVHAHTSHGTQTTVHVQSTYAGVMQAHTRATRTRECGAFLATRVERSTFLVGTSDV